MKLSAKGLYNTLTEKCNELFIVGWQNDPQPKERAKGEIVYILNKFLPESYDREVFLRKSTLVFDHIVDQAINDYNWVARKDGSSALTKEFKFNVTIKVKRCPIRG